MFDTNVVVSALLFPTASLRRVSRLWKQGYAIPVVSRKTVAELLKVLAYPKFNLATDEMEELLAEYIPFAEIHEPNDMRAAISAPDPYDQMFIDLLVSSKAVGLVSGDKGLQSMVPHYTIFSPSAFLAQYP